MVARKFAPGHAFVDVGGHDRIRLNADSGEQIEATRTRRSENQPHELDLARVAGRSCAAGHEAISDSALGQIVRRHLDQHLVAGQHADAILAHLAGGVTEDLMAVLEMRGRVVELLPNAMFRPHGRASREDLPWPSNILLRAEKSPGLT